MHDKVVFWLSAYLHLNNIYCIDKVISWLSAYRHLNNLYCICKDVFWTSAYLHLNSLYCIDKVIFWLSAYRHLINLCCIGKVIFRVSGKSAVVLERIYDNNPFSSLPLSQGPTEEERRNAGEDQAYVLDVRLSLRMHS